MNSSRLQKAMRRQVANTICPDRILELSTAIGLRSGTVELTGSEETDQIEHAITTLRTEQPTSAQYKCSERALAMVDLRQIVGDLRYTVVGLSWSEYCGFFRLEGQQFEPFLNHYLKVNQEEPVFLFANNSVMAVLASYDDVEDGSVENEYYQLRIYGSYVSSKECDATR